MIMGRICCGSIIWRTRIRAEDLSHGVRQAAGVFWGDSGGGRDLGDAVREDEPTSGSATGGFFVSREEYDDVFSAGDVGGGECGAVDCAVLGEPLAAMRAQSKVWGS